MVEQDYLIHYGVKGMKWGVIRRESWRRKGTSYNVRPMVDEDVRVSNSKRLKYKSDSIYNRLMGNQRVLSDKKANKVERKATRIAEKAIKKSTKFYNKNKKSLGKIQTKAEKARSKGNYAKEHVLNIVAKDYNKNMSELKNVAKNSKQFLNDVKAKKIKPGRDYMVKRSIDEEIKGIPNYYGLDDQIYYGNIKREVLRMDKKKRSR